MKIWTNFFAAIFAVVVIVPARIFAVVPVSRMPIVLNDNGAWCWFQSERALVDQTNNTLLVASVADSDGVDGKERSGDVDVVAYDLGSGATRKFTLHAKLQPEDDHNTAGLLIRPDGRYLAMYSRHHKDSFSFYRISARPHDATEWGEEKTFDWASHLSADGKDHATYSNLFYLSAEKRVYDFTRAVNLDPTILTSMDQGDTWEYAGKLLTIPRLGYVNGYTKYATNGVDRIDIITTEHHPRDFNNSVYHGYIEGGKLHNSTGDVVDDNILYSAGHPQTELTKVFAASTVVDGDTLTHSWIADIRLDAENHPYALLTARANDIPDKTNFSDHRFLYARFDGKAWRVTALAKAGANLWKSEEDYIGLGVLNPSDANTLYISTTVDPRTNVAMTLHEIYKGVTADGGVTWAWTAITENSKVDNLRPVVPVWGKEHTGLLWFRGTMTRSQHYKCEVVGLIDP